MEDVGTFFNSATDEKRERKEIRGVLLPSNSPRSKAGWRMATRKSLKLRETPRLARPFLVKKGPLRGGIFIEGEMIKNVIGGENSVEKGEGSVPLKALFDLFHYLDRFPRYKYSKFPPQLRYTD